MKRKVYSMLVIPLLFGACNSSSQASLDVSNRVSSNVQPATQQVISAVNSGVSSKNTISSNNKLASSSRLRYVIKPIVIEEGMFHIKEFGKTINSTLNGAMAQDRSGVLGMGVCNSMASKMVNDYNNITPNVTIRRTALKYRNPANKPDKTDEDVMYALVDSKDFKPVAVDMGSTYRVYKPLRIETRCLACHGDENRMSKQVKQMIKEKYPEDMATGFKEGDLRGVVVAEFPKEH